MKFTDEEKLLIYKFSNLNEQKFSNMYILSYLIAIAGFGLYGFYRNDVVAMGMALIASFVFQGWKYAYEEKILPTYISVFSKVAKFLQEREAGESKNDG